MSLDVDVLIEDSVPVYYVLSVYRVVKELFSSKLVYGSRNLDLIPAFITREFM